MTGIILQEDIEKKIYIIRGIKVMLDKDLAKLYRVKSIRLREQVMRNLKRFPIDFMFKLNDTEVEIMLSHFAIPSRKYLGGHNPYVFTEQGVAMLSGILRSDRAIQVNIAIMRTFVKLKKIISTNKEFSDKLNELERKIKNHDDNIITIFEAIKQLMSPITEQSKKIGFI